jgi:hypothetical protein
MKPESLPAFHRRCIRCERVLIYSAFRPTPLGHLPIGRCRECDIASTPAAQRKKKAALLEA